MDTSICGLMALPEELLDLILASLRMHDLNSFCRSSWRCHRLTYVRLFHLYQIEREASCLDYVVRHGLSEGLNRALVNGLAECRFAHLATAVRHNEHADVVRILLKQPNLLDEWHKQNREAPSPGHKSPLFLACNATPQVLAEEMVDLLIGTEPGRQDNAIFSTDSVEGAAPAICVAAQHGYIGILRKLVSLGASIEAKIDGLTPLWFAVCHDRGPAIDFLVDSGADANHLSDEGECLLARAARSGKTSAEILLRHGVSVSQPNRNSRTALHEAARHGHDDLANHLIDLGADTTARDRKGNFSLHEAVKCGSCTIPTLSRLIDSGNNVNCTDDNFGETPLYKAIKTCAPACVIDFLLSAGADPSIARTDVDCELLPVEAIKFEWGIRGYSAEEGLKVLQAFQKHGVALEVENTGLTVLKALKFGDADILDFVLLHRSQPLKFVNAGDIESPSGNIVLPARNARTPRFLMSLLHHGMRLADRTATTQTILHRLVVETWVTEWVVGSLLAHPALDFNAVDDNGDTALHLVCRYYSRQQSVSRWIPLLLKSGADMDITNKAGKTPMDIARGSVEQGAKSDSGSWLAVIILTRFRHRRRRTALRDWKALSLRRKSLVAREDNDVWEEIDNLALLD